MQYVRGMNNTLIQQRKDKEISTKRRVNVSIDADVKEKLDQIGRISQSYSELIGELVEYWIKGHSGK
jgi:hypothetical protein